MAKVVGQAGKVAKTAPRFSSDLPAMQCVLVKSPEERLGTSLVQVWDLKKAGQLFDRDGFDLVWTRVNTQTVKLFAQIARLTPGS